MKEMKFRDLKAEEIDVRVGQAKESFLTLLLYKDARCDMQILDETVGPMSWQRHHSRENANCTVSIHDDKMNCWVEKEDVGVPSNTEAEKGLASDSFKRACVNWGIGRELYTAPEIKIWWNNGENYKRAEKNEKFGTYDRFVVSCIKIEDKRIIELQIVNTTTNKAVFSWGINSKPKEKKSKKSEAEEAPTPMPTDDYRADLEEALATKLPTKGGGSMAIGAMTDEQLYAMYKCFFEKNPEAARRIKLVMDDRERAGA